MTGGDRVRWVLRGLGQTLITAGVVLLLFCAYELKVTGIYTEKQQGQLDDEIQHSWAQKPRPGQPTLAAYEPGKGIARIYLPSLGKDEVYVVVEGVGRADLKKGPGHYPGTATMGAIGNAVISGHRTTYGAPFNRLDELENGDPIVIETQGSFFTYRVTGETVVKPTAIGETLPVPNSPGTRPTQRVLTLTTCNPKYSAKTRLIIRGLLESTLAKSTGKVPPALGG